MHPTKNNIAQFLQTHVKILLPLVSLLLVIIPLIMRETSGKILYNTAQAYTLLSVQGLPNFIPFKYVMQIISTSQIAQVLYIGVIAFTLAYLVAQRGQKIQLAWLIFLSSPLGLVTFGEVSGYGWSLLWMYITYLLIISENRTRYLAPLTAIIAIVDLYTTVLMMVLLFLKLRDKRITKIVTATTLVWAAIILPSAKLFLGPFNEQEILTTLIADIGSHMGVSVFILLTALIGYVVTSKKNKAEYTLLLAITLTAHAFNVATAPFVIALGAYLAVEGITFLTKQEWESEQIKKVAMLLIVLGVMFSTLSFYTESTSDTLTKNDREVLEWIQEDTTSDTKVISYPLNSGIIHYFAKREPVGSYEEKTQEKAQRILQANYLREVEAELEQEEYVIFISSKMRQDLEQNQGISLLLQSESFKLSFSRSQSEVWSIE